MLKGISEAFFCKSILTAFLSVLRASFWGRIFHRAEKSRRFSCLSQGLAESEKAKRSFDLCDSKHSKAPSSRFSQAVRHLAMVESILAILSESARCDMKRIGLVTKKK